MSKNLKIDVSASTVSDDESPTLTSRKTPFHTPATTPVGNKKGTNKIKPDEKYEELTQEEKREAILTEPNFGMMTMTRIFCREEKYTYVLLPLSLLLGQWLILFAVVAHNLADPQQCGTSTLHMKLLFVGICLVYYVESIQLIDNLSRRVQSRKIIETSYSTLWDRCHEDLFTLSVFVTNLIIVLYNTQNLLEAMFNCLAMTFLSDLENEWQKAYYSTRLEEAAHVYDNIFVGVNKNRKRIKKRMKSSLFFIVLWVASVVFSFTYMLYRILPVFSICMLILGILCK